MPPHHPIIPSGPAATILLREFLRVTIHLARKACAEIRAVQANRESSAASFVADLKDNNDPRSWLTEADVRAQRVLVGGLRRAFGKGLRIVAEEGDIGEEEDRGHTDEAEAEALAGVRKNPEICQIDVPSGLETLSLDQVVVYVDPLDGTREFVEKRLDAVQTLIGVSVRGRAVAGVVGLPFLVRAGGHADVDVRRQEATPAPGRPDAVPNKPQQTTIGETTSTSKQPLSVNSTESHVLYGVVGSADRIVGLDVVHSRFARTDHDLSDSQPLTLAISADLGAKSFAISKPRDLFLSLSAEAQMLVAGACGNKALQVALGVADAAVFNTSSSLWDVCAWEALLHCCGGKLTTAFGWPIFYHGSCGVGGSCANGELLSQADHYRNCDAGSAENSSVDAAPEAPELALTNRWGVFLSSARFREKLKSVSAMSIPPISDHDSFLMRMRGEKDLLKETMSQTGLDIQQTVLDQEGALSSVQRARNVLDFPFDVARTLDGQPFSTAFLENALGADAGSLRGWSLDPQSTFRFKQSVACRVRLHWKDGSPHEKSLFCKRSVLRELPHAVQKATSAPFKLRRDIQANVNEATFLQRFDFSDLAAPRPAAATTNSAGDDTAIGSRDDKSSSFRLVIRWPYLAEQRVFPATPAATPVDRAKILTVDTECDLDAGFLLLLPDFSPCPSNSPMKDKDGPWHQLGFFRSGLARRAPSPTPSGRNRGATTRQQRQRHDPDAPSSPGFGEVSRGVLADRRGRGLQGREARAIPTGSMGERRLLGAQEVAAGAFGR